MKKAVYSISCFFLFAGVIIEAKGNSCPEKSFSEKNFMEEIMDKVKKFFESKSYGFYVSIGLAVLSLVTAIVYASLFHMSRYMSWGAFAVVIVGVVLAAVLPFLKQAKWSCCAIALADFIALLLYAYNIYFYVSVVMVGIQASTFSPQFLACTSLFAILLVLNIANVFLKQEKTEK